jgi:hypothetical protein
MTDEELRALAEAADTSPHWYDYTIFTLVEKEEDAAYAAAASPDVVLGLLDRLDAANAALLQSQAREVGADARIKELEQKLIDMGAAWQQDRDRASQFLRERDEAREAVRRLAGELVRLSELVGDVDVAMIDEALSDPIVKRIVEGE